MSRSLVTLDEPCATAATPPTTTNLIFFRVRPPSIEVKLTWKLSSPPERTRCWLRAAPIARREYAAAQTGANRHRFRSARQHLLHRGRRLGQRSVRAGAASPGRVRAKDWRGKSSRNAGGRRLETWNLKDQPRQ